MCLRNLLALAPARVSILAHTLFVNNNGRTALNTKPVSLFLLNNLLTI